MLAHPASRVISKVTGIAIFVTWSYPFLLRADRFCASGPHEERTAL